MRIDDETFERAAEAAREAYGNWFGDWDDDAACPEYKRQDWRDVVTAVLNEVDPEMPQRLWVLAARESLHSLEKAPVNVGAVNARSDVEVELVALQRIQAHALVGILEHLLNGGDGR